MTPLFKNYEQAQRSRFCLFREGYRGRRSLLEGPFEDFQVGQNVRFLDVIRRAGCESFIQRIVDAAIVANFRLQLLPDRYALIVHVLQHAHGIIRRKARFARHDVGLQAGLLLVDAVLDERAAGAVNDKFRIVDFHQMAGFDDGFQVAVEQLRFKSVVRVGFITQAADVVCDMIRSAKQGDDLVHGMHARP